jgi:hypothetical protein
MTDEVMGGSGGGEVHNEELKELYCSLNISGDKIEKNEKDGACSVFGGG